MPALIDLSLIAGINKRIEPSPMVRFAFGNNSQQVSLHS